MLRGDLSERNNWNGQKDIFEGLKSVRRRLSKDLPVEIIRRDSILGLGFVERWVQNCSIDAASMQSSADDLRCAES
jgi:hypothetical protein